MPRARPATVLRSLAAAGTEFRFFPNGGLYDIRRGNLTLNLMLGTAPEGGIGGVWLRTLSGRTPCATRITGPRAASAFDWVDGLPTWRGAWGGLRYACRLHPHPREPEWSWIVTVRNDTRGVLRGDAVFLQDIGLAATAAVRINEAFVSQYLDHRALRAPDGGFVVRTRQNQAQADGTHPGLLHDCRPGAVGYLSDAADFFGNAFRAGAQPAGLCLRTPPARILQGELAAAVLYAPVTRLRPGGEITWTFRTRFAHDLPPLDDRRGKPPRLQTRSAVPPAPARAEPRYTTPVRALPPLANCFTAVPLLDARPLSRRELETIFPRPWRNVESPRGTLHSFFHGADAHVVLPAKDRAASRPHGHILRSGAALEPSPADMTSTVFMHGVFNSYVTLGNLSFNRFVTLVRDPLNLQRTAGQRVFARTEGRWHLLGMPSAFEMTRHACRWFYRTRNGLLVVTSRIAVDRPELVLELNVRRGPPGEFLVAHEILAGNDLDPAYPARARLASNGALHWSAVPGQLLAAFHPRASFSVRPGNPRHVAAAGGAELLFADNVPHGHAAAVFRTRPVRQTVFLLTGSLDAHRRRPSRPGNANDYWQRITGNLALDGTRTPAALARIRDTLDWYAADALIHLLSPHGLEQTTGAAWGVRDVCQGPVEFLLALRHDAAVRKILLRVYSAQYADSALWPQWFMFDEYRHIQSRDSHGDVVYWPLKALCDYLETTRDTAILDEPLPFTVPPAMRPSPACKPLAQHVALQLAAIRRERLPGLGLPRYGHGDWDDTLQPADPARAARMVSAWTSALAVQTLERFAACTAETAHDALGRLAGTLARHMREAFRVHLLPDGIVPGFVVSRTRGAARRLHFLLHPSDRETGLRYRLIAMTRAILAGLLTPAEACDHLRLIRRHLAAPDGVRLMDRPVPYCGGATHWFQRAETAAHFGREIGLMYVHAHLRYAETLARMGRANELLTAVLQVTPVGLNGSVPHATARQANAYFSSSDAAFSDRYAAQRDFRKIRQARIAVHGGWRVYSSGPGLYYALVLTRMLGIRTAGADLVLDPILPRALDGLRVRIRLTGRVLAIDYRVRGTGPIREVTLNGKRLTGLAREPNPYRRGGCIIPADRLPPEALLQMVVEC